MHSLVSNLRFNNKNLKKSYNSPTLLDSVSYYQHILWGILWGNYLKANVNLIKKV